ncbi:MAG: fumarylacetoacetate hydrolase family protein [Smithellaceae bacterium]|nr:fumarylacetoacetate hydrolase family protein [Smithellaceae bacterium]
MKIVRFVSKKRGILYGVYDERRPGTAESIEGDPWNTANSGDREERIEQLLAPVAPVNILALGVNYRKHGDEIALSVPVEPILFLKATSSVTGPDHSILLPAAGPDQVDYEAELAVVIGKTAKNISPAEAPEYIFGYTCANDVSARDWQFERQKDQWARGKSFDTFCPLGPWIVTKDEIENPDDLAIRAVLNGKTLQESRTSEMIFDVRTIVSRLSRSMTLHPGTVILTGTPEGVGFGRRPPVFLKPGDEIRVEIEKIGILSNRVIAES